MGIPINGPSTTLSPDDDAARAAAKGIESRRRLAQIVRLLLESTVVTIALLLAAPAAAQEIRGLVARVTSGDRLVLKAPDQTVRVRLANVIAPARDEPLGEESWQSLRQLCLGRAATLYPVGTDPDGSTVGEVSCAGVRADEAQLRRGLARADPRILPFDSELQLAQTEARTRGSGIWSGR